MTCNAQTISRRRFFYPFFGLLLLFIGGCASPTFQQDYRPDTDFRDLKTYTWRKVSSTVPAIEQSYLQQLADQHLASRGFTKVAQDADMLLDLTLLTQINTAASTGVGMSIGLPVGRSGSIGLGGGKSLPRTKEEGALVLDVTRGSDNSLIWRGTGEGIPLKHLSLQNSAQLAGAVEKLLAQFPPSQ